MTLFEAVKERYSYRGEFKSSPVSREDIRKILDAGLAAPSGCNAQTAYLVGIDDPGIIKKIASILNKSKAATASAAVCVVTNAIPSYKDMYFNIQDYSASIENMLLAITAMGYASCWIEGEVTSERERQKALADLLGIPKEFAVVAILPLGVPASPGRRAVHRPFEERAFFNRFGGDNG